MLRAAAIALVLLALPSLARAQAPADAPAPTQATSTDGALGHRWLSFRTDVASPFFGVWGGTADVAPCPWLSVGVTPAYVSRDSGTGFSADVTVRAWPLARGLDGPFLGAVAAVLRTSRDDGTTLALSGGADAGWQLVWGPLTFAVSGGAVWTGAVDGPAQGIEGWSPRVRVELGASWR